MMRQEIYKKVLAAMQDAEEMGGPEGREYLGLMQDIAAEATRRRETYLANIDPYRKLVEQISRMKTEEEFEDGDCPPSEDWISTLSDLIVDARQAIAKAEGR